MLAYLAMMAPRLLEMRRVLKPSGSIYLHCDPTASHYLKLLMDAIFGAQNFRNEITWKRANTVKGNFGQGARFFGRNTDSLLFYGRSESSYFDQQFQPYSKEYEETFYHHVEPESGRRYALVSMTGPGGAAKGNPSYEVMGVTRFWRYSKEKMKELIDAGMVVQPKPGAVPRHKYYLDEGRGVPVQALWDDISSLHSNSKERHRKRPRRSASGGRREGRRCDRRAHHVPGADETNARERGGRGFLHITGLGHELPAHPTPHRP